MPKENLSNCRIEWQRKAVLQHRSAPSTRELWVGEQLYDGTVAGAVRYFTSLPKEKQDRTEMFADSGVIEGREEDTIVGPDILRVLASRDDVPE